MKKKPSNKTDYPLTRMAWLFDEWRAHKDYKWDSAHDVTLPGEVAQLYGKSDPDAFAALEQTWARWQGLA